jgi:Skp family chaperone for outer membrane proteins
MANSRPSFQKRQKEMARQQRAADKLQKRLQKKQGTDSGTTENNADTGTNTEEDEFGQPAGLDFHDF